MKKKTVMSKLTPLGVVLCLLASMAIFGCATPSPTPSTEPAPTPPAQTGPQYGGILKVSDIFDAGASLGYPPKLLRVYSMRQSSPVIESLFRIDETGKVVPWLATGYTSDVAAKTLTLILREGVKFHDGTDFNAEAVKWNLEQHINAKRADAAKFTSIDVLDNYTVRINLSEWDNTIISNMTQALGMIISPTACEKNGIEWAESNPIGTGPFEFVSWEKDVRTVFKKFDGYWQKGKPYLDGIEYIPIPDTLTRQLSLRGNEIHLALTLDAKDLTGLEKDGFPVTRINVGSGAVSAIPDSANPNSPWADVKVRQAAQHAIDSELIVQSILFGEAEPANQWIYKRHWGYNPNVKGYPYNPEKAKQLLADAGYPNGFKTKILYRTNPRDDKIFTAVQGFLKDVGIDAELEPTTTGRYDEVAFQGDSWEGLIMNAVSPNPDLPAALALRYSGGGKFFTQMLVPDDYVQAIQNAITAPDFETKQKYTQEAMKLMIDKYALQVVIYCMFDYAVSQPYLHNHGYFDTPNTTAWTPEEAWLEK